MIVRVVNKWLYQGKEFPINSLVDMPQELFTHLFEVSTVEEVKLVPALKVFDALIKGITISDEVKEKINLVEGEGEFSFKIDYNEPIKFVDEEGKDSERKEARVAYFLVSKDPAKQILN